MTNSFFPFLIILAAGINLMACAQNSQTQIVEMQEDKGTSSELMKATFGSGCFWCTEAFFAELKGVYSVTSGYSGGQIKNPSYREVCSGRTGHAEVIQLEYDPSLISFGELLEVFWQTHDPTTLNRQGADVGTQYRSAIFYHSEQQQDEAEAYMKVLDEAGIWSDPIVTEISEFQSFFIADESHQDYYALNPNAGYCRVVITPKMEKFRKVFAEKLK